MEDIGILQLPKTIKILESNKMFKQAVYKKLVIDILETLLIIFMFAMKSHCYHYVICCITSFRDGEADLVFSAGFANY